MGRLGSATLEASSRLCSVGSSGEPRLALKEPSGVGVLRTLRWSLYDPAHFQEVSYEGGLSLRDRVLRPVPDPMEQ